MSIRVSALVLMASLALTTGCPSGDGDGDGEAGDGSAGASGASSSGTGGDSGESGTGSGGGGGSNSGVSAEDAASGMCGMTGGDSNCTGLDAYQTCIETSCAIDECYDGPCESYIACLQGADDPCNASSECPIPMECQTCFTDKASCFSNCLSEVECDGMPVGGGATDGGACDQLDACCATLDAEQMTQCTMTADVIRIGGDMACEGALMVYCP